MSNPNNLIRPPVLGNTTPVAPIGPSGSGTQISPELAHLVKNAVTQMLQTDGQSIIQSILNNGTNQNIRDQTIDERYRDNMNEMDKIPDVVRSLREFSGNASEFTSWKKSVERILRIYEPSKGTPRYFGILNVIRNKIIGKADIALESYNTPLDWTAISRCLTTHYADKRDIGTLEYQMTCLIQGRLTINEFYQKVYSHLSLILNKIGCMEVGEEAIHLLTENYRAKALDTFVRGLSGDLPRLLGIREPKSLPEALHLCLKLENQNFRANHANNQFPRQQFQQQNFFPNPNRQPPQTKFHPELAFIPKPNQIFNPYGQQRYPQNPVNQQHGFHNQNPFNQPPNNPPPRPPKPPQPMDVDVSLRTNAINYANRPNPKFTVKRPSNFSNKNDLQPKVQRNFHVNSNFEPYSEQNYQYNNDYQNNEYNYDFSDTTQTDENEQSLDLTDVHFLD